MKEIFQEIVKMGIPEKISKKLFSRFKSESDRMDYVQEMYLIIMETNPEKLKNMIEKKELANYFAKICLNQITNNKSTFSKKYEYNINKEEFNADRKEYENEKQYE